MQKYLPIEVILADQDVAKLYVDDKVEREASFALMRAVLWQMQQVFHEPVRRSFLGADVLVHSLQDREERRVTLADGTMCIVNLRTAVSRPVFPAGFDVRNLLVTKHQVDRCKIGSSMLSFGMHIGSSMLSFGMHRVIYVQRYLIVVVVVISHWVSVRWVARPQLDESGNIRRP